MAAEGFRVTPTAGRETMACPRGASARSWAGWVTPDRRIAVLGKWQAPSTGSASAAKTSSWQRRRSWGGGEGKRGVALTDDAFYSERARGYRGVHSPY